MNNECVHSLIGRCSMCGDNKELPIKPCDRIEALEAKLESQIEESSYYQNLLESRDAKVKELEAYIEANRPKIVKGFDGEDVALI